MKADQMRREIAAQAIKSGQTVECVNGKSKGLTGVVFYVGTTRFGQRVGFKQDGGTKVWVRPDQVVAIGDAPQPGTPAPTVAPDGMTAQQRWQVVLDLQAQLLTAMARITTLEQEAQALTAIVMNADPEPVEEPIEAELVAIPKAPRARRRAGAEG